LQRAIVSKSRYSRIGLNSLLFTSKAQLLTNTLFYSTHSTDADLSKKPFFPGLVNFFSSGPVVAMVWEGKGAIKTGRVMLGATNPAESAPGSIRGDLCVDIVGIAGQYV
jgi:nucleoside diphosphate kinase